MYDMYILRMMSVVHITAWKWMHRRERACCLVYVRVFQQSVQLNVLIAMGMLKEMESLSQIVIVIQRNPRFKFFEISFFGFRPCFQSFLCVYLQIYLLLKVFFLRLYLLIFSVVLQDRYYARACIQFKDNQVRPCHLCSGVLCCAKCI